MKPVSVDSVGKFIGLLEANAPKIIDENYPQGWVNFYRQDDHCTTAYFYLDRPSNGLPPLPPVEVLTANLK